jgi:hypothetical protein
MEFGLGKYTSAVFKHDQLTKWQNIRLNNQREIRKMDHNNIILVWVMCT